MRISSLVLVGGVAALGALVLTAGWLDYHPFGGRPVGSDGASPSGASPPGRSADPVDPLRSPRSQADAQEAALHGPATTGAVDASSRPDPRTLLQRIDACLEGLDPSDEMHTRLCLAGVDLKDLGPDPLAGWLCDTPASFQAVSLVLQARVVQLEPTEVMGFIQRVQDGCDKFQESGLTLSCLTYGRSLSEAWYREVLSMVDPGMLLPENGSQAVIQIVEQFVKDGDPTAGRLLEDIGTGALGGTSEQVHRAALVTMVNKTTAQEKLDYLTSVTGPSAPRSDDLGNLLGQFLADGSCYLDGDPRPALSLLAEVLHDPRFAQGCAWQLASLSDHQAPPGDGGLWQTVMDRAEIVRVYGP